MAQMEPENHGVDQLPEAYGEGKTTLTGAERSSTPTGAANKKQGFTEKIMTTFNNVKEKLAPATSPHGTTQLDSNQTASGPAHPTGSPTAPNFVDKMKEELTPGKHHNSSYQSTDNQMTGAPGTSPTGTDRQNEEFRGQGYDATSRPHNASPDANRKPGFIENLKDKFTGQKPGHGTGTGLATTGTMDPPGHTPQNYTATPTPITGNVTPGKYHDSYQNTVPPTGTGGPGYEETSRPHDGTPAAHHKPGFVENLKEKITGHGTGPGHTTTGPVDASAYSTAATTESNEARHTPVTYTETPTPVTGHGGDSFLEKTMNRLAGHKQPQDGAANATSWPEPAHPSLGSLLQQEPATSTAPTSVPTEGHKDDSMKKDGIMEKLMDKLHLGHKDAREHKPTISPKANTASGVAPTNPNVY